MNVSHPKHNQPPSSLADLWSMGARCALWMAAAWTICGGSAISALAGSPPARPAEQAPKRPNILLLTADDLNCDCVGVYGCPVPDTTPNIDRLASQGMRFERAHVTIAVCQPSRNVWLSGRYPHVSGGEGFHKLQVPGLPVLPGVLREHGYLVGLFGKVPHCTPYADFQWDAVQSQASLGAGRNPRLYGEYAAEFFRRAKAEGKPFFLMANSHDPHRPFYGNDHYRYGTPDGPQVPSRVFKPEEVVVPGFLPDLPEVRREIAEYYSSVRRCDDTVGEVLAALEKSGLAEETIVMFLSDHGMPLPFAKTNVYYHSTRTPWIVRWPGHIEPGSVDHEHLVSGVDMMPTLLDLVGIEPPPGLDGFSFKPLLFGQDQPGRDMVFTQFHQTAARRRYPMRAVQDRRFLYIYNPWSDGERIFRNESQSGRTMKAMLAAAEHDPAIEARCRLFLYRVPEEFYDLQNDPDALHNLIDDPDYQQDIQRLRRALADWMRRTKDPALAAFLARGDEQARRQFMAEQDAKAQAGRTSRPQRRATGSKAEREQGTGKRPAGAPSRSAPGRSRQDAPARG